ncbi:hypothetical protein BEH94_10175 [Candidatus Altiarchaeales archaeon WOR_SM1_SCG]|nr:hypothetical protein BEH94_10175 [Candidatus Altiarchaeales archaeon WOR_SM1_SCG]
MGERKHLIENIRKFKNNLNREKRIDKIILFGSRATGRSQKDSDADLIIVSPFFREMKSGRARGLHKYWNLDMPVDFICYTPEEFEEKRKQVSLVRLAVEEGIEI